MPRIQKPPSSRHGTSAGIDQSQLPEHLKIIPKRPGGWGYWEASQDVPESPRLTIAEHLENIPLPAGQVMAHPQRRCVPAEVKPHDDVARLLLEVGLGLTRGLAQFDDPLRAPTPALDQSAPIKDFRDQGVPWSGDVIPLQVVDHDPGRKETGADDLQPVIEDRHVDRSPGIE